MPDDRFFHKRAGHSEKVNSLTDFEELVWRYYVLSSDDFGVMRWDHRQIQSDHERAGNRPAKAVQRALEHIVGIGLVHAFDHQGRTYGYSRNWQRYQKIDYPRETINPCPPAGELTACEEDTAKLFYSYPGGKIGREKKSRMSAESVGDHSAKDSRMSVESFGEDLRFTRAGAKAEAKAKANGSGLGTLPAGAIVESDLGDRARRFIERYAELFYEHRRGARYYAKPALDFPEAVRLCETWPDDRLDTLAVAFLTTDDKFCRQGSGAIAHFASRASWCDGKLREQGL